MKKYKKSLVIAVGGGNDSISTILLQLQLQKQLGYNPDEIDILSVLPDCVEYLNMDNLFNNILFKINPNSERSIEGSILNAFPEKILARHLDYFDELNLKNTLGVSTTHGSLGIYKSLKYLLELKSYDLIFAIDVGGDLIAHKDNVDVLSPMMDGLVLNALNFLKDFITVTKIETDILYSVLGLGTDGESTPEMLDKALSQLPDIQEFKFNRNYIEKFIPFYRNIVEKNRYSRTTDYMIKEIIGEDHPNPSDFRARFHCNENKYYSYFSHKQDEKFFGKFYLFSDVSQLNNPFSFYCNSSLEWAIKACTEAIGLNHELNGQCLNMEGKRIFIGTPSKRFDKDREKIINDILLMLNENKYDLALVYNNDLKYIDENNSLKIKMVSNSLSLISI